MRCFNPPRLDEPARLAQPRPPQVPDRGRATVGVRHRPLRRPGTGRATERAASPPWRDTGVEMRGPAVADVARAFAETWAALRRRRCPTTRCRRAAARRRATSRCAWSPPRPEPRGSSASTRWWPRSPGSTLWLTDAYYAGTTRLRAGAARRGAGRRRRAAAGARARQRHPRRAGRLARRLSRRCSMPACASSSGTGRCCTPRPPWPTGAGRASAPRTSTSRAGSATASWTWWSRTRASAAPDGGAVRRGHRQLHRDRAKPEAARALRRRRPACRAAAGAGGSASRAAAGALRFGNAIGAVLSPRKLHGAAERRVLLPAALALISLAPIAILWPQALAWPLGIFALWMGLALLVRALRITRSRPPA